MAEKLASEGYAVLAVDLYDGEVAKDAAKAQQLMSTIKQDEATANLKAAAEYLREHEHVTKLGSLGWCFGGGQSLQLSLSEPLDATVIYYGMVTNDETQLSKIHSPVLGIFGVKDQAIPVQSAHDFEKGLNDVGISNEIHYYPGVGHAFANPSNPGYAPDETKDAWAKTLAFLAKNLKA